MTTTPPKRSRQALRRRYTWHMRPPFEDRFDRSHWWEGQGKSDVSPEAALYELARRHPLVCEVLSGETGLYEGDAVFPPPPLDWLWRIGLQSWPGVNKYDRAIWMLSSHGIKGLDMRDEAWNAPFMELLGNLSLLDERIAVDKPCHAINTVARLSILGQRITASEREAKTCEEQMDIVRKGLATNPLTADEWEAAIAQCAVAAHRKGYLLLAVAPDLKAEEAESVMAAKYKEHSEQRLPGKPKQRPRREDWLPLISEFEDAETSPHKAKSQVFARYRRALDGIRFT